MSPNELREIDAKVATLAMGLRVVGKATCVYVEGEWSVHVDSETDGWACHAETAPVAVAEYCNGEHTPLHLTVYPDDDAEAIQHKRVLNEQADAELASDLARFGHSRMCLQVVPQYSCDISAAFTVVAAMRAKGLWVDLVGRSGPNHADGWTAWFYDGTRLDADGAAAAETLPLAICRAALNAIESAAAESAVESPSLTLPPSEPRPND